MQMMNNKETGLPLSWLLKLIHGSTTYAIDNVHFEFNVMHDSLHSEFNEKPTSTYFANQCCILLNKI